MRVEDADSPRHSGDSAGSQDLGDTPWLVLGGGGLKGLALVLAVLGVYGVVSFSVSRRKREVGIRMALGAGSQSVVRLFVRDVAVIVIGGAIAGLVISLPAGRFVGQQFTGGQGSPWLIAAIAAGLVATALVATLTPALRAAQTDPTDSLRQE